MFLGRLEPSLSVDPNQICIIASGKVGQNSKDGEEPLATCSRVVVGSLSTAGEAEFPAMETVSEAFLLRARLCTRRLALLVFLAGARRLASGLFADFLEPAVLSFLIEV